VLGIGDTHAGAACGVNRRFACGNDLIGAGDLLGDAALHVINEERGAGDIGVIRWKSAGHMAKCS
jgi:hypothetical protein